MECEINVNDVFVDKDANKTFRVLWVSTDFYYVIAIEGRSGIPIKMTREAVVNGFSTGKFEKILDPVQLNVREPSKKSKERRDKLWDLVQETFCNEPSIYEKNDRGRLINELSFKTGMPKDSLYKLLRRYWKYGKVPNAFLPNYLKCGGRGKERPLSSSGRPTKKGRVRGKLLDEKDYVNFEYAIRNYYLTKQESTMEKTFKRMLSECYSFLDEHNVIKLLPVGQLPSFRQLTYWYYKKYNIKQEIQKRKGNNEFELTGRAITGKADFGLMGPGSQFQIDATIGDIYLVSRFNRKDIIGRPVMYFVIDAFSRLIAGMYIGLEGPSWAGMMEALYNASVDKVSYCRQYGIEITEEQWPCHHVPAVLLGDRGELESHKADKLVTALGIRVDNTPPFRGDLKPFIERFFRTINTTVSMPLLPGNTIKKRKGHDYRLDATLDLWQFTQIMIHCVLYYNNHHYLASFEKNAQMMQSDVEAIPIKLWNWGITNQSGILRTFPEETIRLALLPSGKASVTEKGICFQELYYTSAKMRNDLWFEKARKKGRHQVDVSYDPRDLGRIYVLDKSSKKYELCELIEWNNKYSGMNLAEIHFEQEKRKAEKSNNERQDIESEINLQHNIDAIVAEAKAMAPDTKDMPKIKRIANIKANRAKEKALIRPEESFVSGKIGAEPVEIYERVLGKTEDSATEVLSPEIRKAAEQAEEDYKKWEMSAMQYIESKNSKNTETTL